MGQDQLLRPRSNTSSPPPSEDPGAELLPRRHEGTTSSAHSLPSNGRSWLPRLLVLVGGVYAVTMVAWSSQNLSLVQADTDSRASASKDAYAQIGTEFSGEEKIDGVGDGTMALNTILKAANHPETDADRELTPEALRREEFQLVVDLPMESSQQREALRQAREAVIAEMKAAKEARSASSGAASETEASGSGLVEKERKRQEAELHALDVLMLPKGDTKQRNFKCVGWRSTGGCSPHGPREPDNDLNCIKLIPFGHSGYCEVEDTETGELFRVMRRYCSSAKYDTSFRCSDATNFINFRRKAREAADKALEPGFMLPNMNDTDQESSRDGIVMVVYPKLIASAYATIKTLRDVLGCRLPIEIWFRRAEMNGYAGSFKPLETLAADNATSFITFHEITDWHAVGFGTKVFAIYNSHFERVLFLDADNAPTRDPAFLFESQEFVDTGAVFWPDFWLPTRTIFNVHSQSLVWELLDIPFVNMFEQESGQLLIDRRRHTEALELVKFYTFHRPSLFDNMKLVHGDKDLFRFAWLKLDAPFHMIQAAPAIAGKIINESFCGLTMVQHDAQGEVLFLHRNSHKLMGELLREPLNYKARAINRSRKKADIRKKARLEGKPIPNWSELDALVQADETPPPTLEPAEPDGYPDSVVWTHLLSFNNSANRTNYVIETYNADPEFPKSQNCYGQRNVSKNEYFYAQDVADLSFAGIETDLRRFAAEAIDIKQQA
ncbi:hypothetical protein BBJ29_005856 [Phytophthora kernoviae]|uniref:Nucleotide-diphospho-sugar transferase domain-containing protein n=1 Tax=Phytophthora kernoviae TaxID=325452 RepID=A0A3F2RI48_9STRA|nr:hypothetical protein BBJ29_005856 [Phytophthora kernoviae]RLN57608.1 hypothetical protein BBP00_00007427 [Phytophthora kernoviae]